MASSGAHTEIVLAGLLFSVAVLVTAARVLAVPYPIFLVLGGLAIAWIPGVPNPELEPDLVGRPDACCGDCLLRRLDDILHLVVDDAADDVVAAAFIRQSAKFILH